MKKKGWHGLVTARLGYEGPVTGVHARTYRKGLRLDAMSRIRNIYVHDGDAVTEIPLSAIDSFCAAGVNGRIECTEATIRNRDGNAIMKAEWYDLHVDGSVECIRSECRGTETWEKAAEETEEYREAISGENPFLTFD